ncbi:MAG TPA: hypothetical protein VI911_11835 [Patescibacteria group bacterium]|nr:hypothetical protein [Patescibacteria group bacterium]
MKFATLRDLVKILNDLPDNVLDKEIHYIDISYCVKEEYEEAFLRLLNDDEKGIELCCN